MSLGEVMMEGTLMSDGTLELDEKPNLPAGRVQVIMQALPELPKDDPFWQRMQAMWDAQKARGHVPRGVEEIEAQQREMRKGWAKRQEAIERLQEESRRLRQGEGGPPP